MHQIWRLQHFLAVAEHGSFHAAARALNLSQPALTKSIRLLETELGTALFLRQPRGVRLTEAGDTLHVRAREIEAVWNASLVELDANGRGVGGQIRIGCGPVYSAVHFPAILAELRRRFPMLKVAVMTGVGADMMPRLRNGDLRAYAGGVPEASDAMGREFRTEVLAMQSNTLFASRNHPLVREGSFALERLLDYPWLSLFSGGTANAKIDRFFLEHDLPSPQLALESHSLQVAVKMISEYQFIACMPVPLARWLPEAQLTNLGVEGFSWSIPTGITYHRSSEAFAPMVAMLKLLRETVERETKKNAAV